MTTSVRVSKNSKVRALQNELDGELTIPVEIFGETYHVRKKFKRLKFLRLLTSDPVSALELVFVDGDMERLEELDIDEDQFAEIINAVSESFTGGSKN
jgi:hypothetical protein